MTQVQAAPTRATPATDERWAGWVVFAALMLAVNGCVNVIQGCVALFNEGYFRVVRGGDLLLINYKAWGVVNVVWGLLLLGAGAGLFFGRGWARWAAILIAGLSVLVQIGFLAAFPIWSLMIIAFDVIVLYALTVHWDVARRSL